MGVIGFLTYNDFVAELRQVRQESGLPLVVRVQDYRRTQTTTIGLQEVTYITIATASDGLDTFVCRYVAGEAYTWDEDRVKAIQQRNLAVAKRMGHDLQTEGFTVRAGIVADSDTVNTRATIPAVWLEKEVAA